MNDTVTIIGTILGSSVFSSIISWLLAKKKYNTEVDNNVIENMQKALNFYKDLSDDTRQRLEAISQQNEDLAKQISELQKEVRESKNYVCYVEHCKARLDNPEDEKPSKK